ncbi:hypothetical protein BACI9J_140052 [Bacillus altitudinis]|nr:hypothetical protein BACI9J_140052 [Bacillus altitudinis]
MFVRRDGFEFCRFIITHIFVNFGIGYLAAKKSIHRVVRMWRGHFSINRRCCEC